MMTFNEFLRKNGVDDNIQATEETVSFENKNGKKFVYPLNDLSRCLRAIWSAGDALDKILGGEWRYDESKYRSALGDVLKGEGWNAVVSNLGSQTPNTVRCLELYAYYLLDKKPTPRLETPTILMAATLDPIFRSTSLADEFKEWMRTRKERPLSPRSIESYAGALSGILSKCAGRPLLEIASPFVIESLRVPVLKHPEVESLDQKGNQMYSAAFNNYAVFLKQRVSTDSPKANMLPYPLLVSGFTKALETTGFALSEPEATR
jgi:hypothetical protein